MINKTHENIRLHQRLHFLMDNRVLWNSIDQKSSRIYFNSSAHSCQLKSSIAELRVLKFEVVFYAQIWRKMKMTLDDSRHHHSIIDEKTGSRLSDV